MSNIWIYSWFVDFISKYPTWFHLLLSRSCMLSRKTFWQWVEPEHCTPLNLLFELLLLLSLLKIAQCCWQLVSSFYPHFSNLGQWVSEVVWHKGDFAHIWPDLIKLHSQQRTCGELSNHKFCLLLPYFCKSFSHYIALVMCEKRPTLILARDTMYVCMCR